MKALPHVLFALVVMTSAGQSVAQGICTDGLSPAFHCEIQRWNAEDRAGSIYNDCLAAAPSSADSQAASDACVSQFTRSISTTANNHAACLRQNQCLW